MNGSGRENHKKEPQRIRIITGLAVEYTVGPPYMEDTPIVDGTQHVTADDIAAAITSEESMILAQMMASTFSDFCRRFPDSRPAAQIIPVNGIDEIDPINLEAE